MQKGYTDARILLLLLSKYFVVSSFGQLHSYLVCLCLIITDIDELTN